MSINPSKERAQVESAINIRQGELAVNEIEQNDAISGENQALAAELRVEATALKAAIGQLRNTRSFWQAEENEVKTSGKQQGELARGA